MPRAPRWCSGHLIPGRRAWPDCFSLPNSRYCQVVLGVQAEGPGPGQGRTAFWRRSCLRKPPGPAGGLGGGLSTAVGTLLLQTLFLPPK